MIKDNLLEVLHEMEEVTKYFKLEPFDIYLIGGGAYYLQIIKREQQNWKNSNT